MKKGVFGIKTLLVNGSLALATLLLVIIASFSAILLVRGVPSNSVSEASGLEGERIVREIVYQPYPAAAAPLLAALLFLLGLLIRKLALAWLGLTVLLVFSLLFLFSSGAALLPLVGVLLVLLTILQFSQRSALARSFLFPGIVLLVGLVIIGYYYLPALTPGQAARRFTWDMLFQDHPVTRTVFLGQDTAVVLSARLEDPERVSIDYSLVRRQGWGWRNLTGGGMTTGRYSNDPAVIDTVGVERGLASPLVYGYLMIRDVRVVEAVLSNGEKREDRQENGLFLLPFDLQSPPCRLQFLNAAGKLIDSVDLTDPSKRSTLPGEIMETVRQRCSQQE